MNDYYRYIDGYLFEDEDYSSFVKVVELIQFPVIKRTECGVWIQMPDGEFINGVYQLKKKFILEQYSYNKTKTNKRFAWATKEEALISYIKRKEKQIWILENQLERAKTFLSYAKDTIKTS
jgi:hypothetical protein